MSEQQSARPELRAITDFLIACVPFDTLTTEQLTDVAGCGSILYLRAGEPLLPDPQAPCLSVVRSGAIEIREADGELLDRCGPGDNFGAGTLLLGAPRELHISAMEDSLLYRFGQQSFHRLRRQNRNFERYFHGQQARRLRRAVHAGDSNPLLTRAVSALLRSAVVAAPPGLDIQSAARLMSEQRVSSLLIVEAGQLIGIVTDRDLRSRALAEGVPANHDIADVMTRAPKSINDDDLVFDALMSMSEHQVHHLPVLRDGTPVGVLSAADLLRAQRNDPVFVIHEISRSSSIDELARVPEALRELVRHWVDRGARAWEISRMLTSVSDAMVRQLIRLAEVGLGPAPVPWAWLGFGSQGRAEQALGADQDNALLLSDDFIAAEHQAYFTALAEQVCQGLARCGYRLCPGDIMAGNPRWRQPLMAWRQIFADWIEQPTPEALMHASIFFDLRCIAGDATLVGQLQEDILQRTRSNSIFIACLCGNVMKHRPPLGFFRTFVLETSGEHRDTLDLKHRGIVPIVDVARLYALAAGIAEVNTLARLRALGGSPALTLKDARSLADACEFIARMRFELQSEQLEKARLPDNYLDPGLLSALRREQLREAFELVRRAQQALAMKYGHRV